MAEDFRTVLEGYITAAGITKEILAHKMGMHPTTFSRRMNKSSNSDLFKNSEIKKLISILAENEGITERYQANDLLKLKNLPPTLFSSQEWENFPLNKLGWATIDPIHYSNSGKILTNNSKQAVPLIARLNKPGRELIEPTFYPKVGKIKSSFPEQAVPLIGREVQIEEISKLLLHQKSQKRLISLLGPGGIGKTRLSLSVAENVKNKFQDGVWVVELASITDSSLLLQTIAQSLGVQETNASGLQSNLFKFLEDKQLLLIIDNFEQLVAASFTLNELLEAAPEIKILVTSRISLDLRSETQYSIPTLDVPNKNTFNNFDEEEIPNFSAVKLFIAKCRTINDSFTPNPDELKDIAELCTKLDGIPLAIELVATRFKFSSILAIKKLLEKSLFSLPNTFLKDIPQRQQTLFKAIDWSYQLLTQEEKLYFSRMAVFIGGFTIEAAKAVCILPNDIVIQKEDENLQTYMQKIVDNLLNQSMIQRVNNSDRYILLEPLREFAAEIVKKADEKNLLRKQHATYYASLINEINEARPLLENSQQVETLLNLETEYGNIRLCIEWLLENDVIKQSLEVGSVLSFFWYIRGYFSEAKNYLLRILKISKDIKSDHKVRILSGLANLISAYDPSENGSDMAIRYYQESLDLGTELEDTSDNILCFNWWGYHLLLQGKPELAEEKFDQSQSLNKKQEYKHGAALTNLYYGLHFLTKSELDRSISYLSTSLEMAEELGDKRIKGFSYNGLGFAAILKEEFDKSKKYHNASLLLAQELQDLQGIIFSIEGIAAASAEKANLIREAVKLFAGTEKLRKEYSLPRPPGYRELSEIEEVIFGKIPPEKLLEFQKEGQAMKYSDIINLTLHLTEVDNI